MGISQNSLVALCLSWLFSRSLMCLLRSVAESYEAKDGNICKPTLAINLHLEANASPRSSYIQIPAYYVVAMPVSLSSAFLLHWEVAGLWVGVALALILVAASQTLVVFMTRWNKVIEEAYMRTRTDEMS